MGISKLEGEMLIARCNRPRRPEPDQPAPEAFTPWDDESALQVAIERECFARGWQPFRSRMDKPSTGRKGMPDFVIALPCGKVLWVECKASGGVLTAEQKQVKTALQPLGHLVHVVYSLQQFQQICAELGL